jgi:tRNA modification GTPase
MVRSLVDAGCQLATWREWLGRNEVDPITVQAQVALAQVRTLRAAAILLDQFQGALRRELDAVRLALEERDRHRARHVLQSIQSHAPTGLHLVQPWRVVLVGPPNVGKSSLMNALVGYRRAIVYDQAGTTRDVVTAMTAVDGWPVELADTAGLCETQDSLEQAGVSRTHEELARADAVVLVFDATEPESVEHRRLRETWPNAICVCNKSDLKVHHGRSRSQAGAWERGNKSDLQAHHSPRTDSIRTSAAAGTGIDALLAAIAQRIVPCPPPPRAAVPFLPEHVEAIEGALSELERDDYVAAVRRLRIRPVGE